MRLFSVFSLYYKSMSVLYLWTIFHFHLRRPVFGRLEDILQKNKKFVFYGLDALRFHFFFLFLRSIWQENILWRQLKIIIHI